jgi:beta-glucanase (GH16 family)
VNRPHRLVAAVEVLCLTLLSACTGHADADGSSSAVPDARAPTSAPGYIPGARFAPPLPAGQKGSWKMAFSDEFDGTSLDRSRWADQSTAEPDEGRGNPANQQLEWNQAANCRVAGGELVMTAKRQQVTSPSSHRRYGWTSCLITSTPSYAFDLGYLEERSILPARRGFWPAFWTWQVRGIDRHTETDVYEFYSDNHSRLYGTQYSGTQGRCEWKPPFDPTTDWHTYGVAIEPSGTTWYVDGAQVCHTDATTDAKTNIISNLAVYSMIPPDGSTTSATKRVDYIRAWQRS